MKNFKTPTKLIPRLLVLVTVMALLITTFLAGGAATEVMADSCITLLDKTISTNFHEFLDGSKIYQLPEAIQEDQSISLIISVQQTPLLDRYGQTDGNMSFAEYYTTSDAAQETKEAIRREKAAHLQDLTDAGIPYRTGADYDVVISGYELVITAKDFESVCKTLGKDVDVYISEVYNTCETEVVTNQVDVYSTGIFDSSDFRYDGSGIVVAVLDTGLDYTHSAFSLDNFSSTNLGLTFEEVESVLSDTVASTLVSGLTAQDVYINEKVPYGFDYADNDSDVYPLNSEHGTHVSGIIAGKDDVITGVAPNAQLVEMKIFSDVYDSAVASWILNALEDCVILGVDVINMSIGTACGFARQSDEELLSGVYEKILDQGISLVVAASNSYNAYYGSDKNGNLPLTSNPDSGTVGSPSTYESAMSVASVSGVPTPYLMYGDRVVYFTESVDRIQKEKHFVDELLDDNTQTIDIEYILIPGAGRSADYTGLDVKGKIALVARGNTTFEEKAAAAQAQGAAGLIIYNNVSGDIKMNVGDATIPVCSISQDDGEVLAEAGSGTLKISVDQTAGPFISDYSSWGPTPSLQIKPEITAHGGNITSAIPGQDYDTISGTSMACPNVAGITALLRQYVKENFPDIANNPAAVTTLVNQLMMSTADILLNTNGNPYAVRKQGAGNANLNNCAATTAFIQTYDKNGNPMTKTKIELGDDPNRDGVYTMTFSIVNFGDTTLTYDLSAFVMTEGVSETKTSHGDTTVTEEAYILHGAQVEVTSKDTNGGTMDGNKKITVSPNETFDLTVTITLSDEDKAYLNDSFENGMYVEGFIVLTNADEDGVDLSVPYLAFFGDWTEAPIFDLTYFDTNADELDDAIDPEDKTMADAYPTRPIGGIYSDYVSYLGSYYFMQDPSVKQITADPDKIALSNQADTINSLRFVWAGLLRNAADITITITDDATGEVIFQRVDTDVRKSYGDGGSIYPANIDVDFSSIDHNLKNNAKYTVTLTAKVDYDDGGVESNDNNTISFPLYCDFEAPAITDCQYYTEYDASTKQTRYFAKMYVYDNHYSMGAQIGYVSYDATEGYILESFDQYLTPIYSSFNTTTEVVYELTDHINEIRKNSDGGNTITVALYDYALNYATYELELPNEFLDITFDGEEITLSPNQVVDLSALVYPENQWSSLLEYYCTSPASGEVARVVNNKLIGVAPGNCVVIARDPETKKQTTIKVKILADGESGYMRYDKPVLDIFELTGYYVNKAFYFVDNTARDIGATGDTQKFTGSSYVLSMYPSESVTLSHKLYAYFPENTDIVYTSSNENIVTVDENGCITAVAKGFASINVQITMDGKNTYYSKSITITVKDPYVTTGPNLTNYFGLGGTVTIPESLKITGIGDYAFSNFTYVDKTEEDFNYDENSETKIFYIGEDTITTVIIPEGVETIGEYAFANMTKLTTVVLPSTLVKIDQGAFFGCPNLTTVTGIENVKFINQYAFANCDLSGDLKLNNCIAVANNAFSGNENLKSVTLSEKTQSVGQYAFQGCSDLKAVTIHAPSIKLGQYVFANCEDLRSIELNTPVIPAGAFYGCKKLESVFLGKDVAVIGEYAFGATNVKEFLIANDNASFKLSADGTYITNVAGDTLVLAMPNTTEFSLNDPKITTIGNGAFAGFAKLTSVDMPYVTKVLDYAFAECSKLRNVTLGSLTHIGDYAFFETKISQLPDLSHVEYLGNYSFNDTYLEEVHIPDGLTVGEYAFSNCGKLESVTIGNDCVLKEGAFSMDSDDNWTSDFYTENDKRFHYYIYTSPLHSLTIGNNADIGDYAFCGAAELESIILGHGAKIGQYSFYNAQSLKDMDLSGVVSIGDYAFSGDILMMGTDNYFTTQCVDEDGYYMYSYHAPLLQNVTLSACVDIGEFAFAYCRQLETVALGEQILNIKTGTFQGCIALKEINLSKVELLDDYALTESVLVQVDLSSATTIGDFALCNVTTLENVSLNPNGCTIGEGAFSYCESLTDLSGEEFATFVGDYAFAYTGLTDADLTSATYIGEYAFMKEELTDFSVVLGTALTELGDNPFAMCRIVPFAEVIVTDFNGLHYTQDNYSYALSETVQIIDGNLYQSVPNGLELVTYTGLEDRLTVADNTVRIGAMAFAGSNVRSVTLPNTLSSIGHKAFCDCTKLQMVNFRSYKAPVLEEEYDYYYFLSYENISGSGDYSFYENDGVTEVWIPGLGITPYFLWNAAESPTTVYYGANFVDYIGHHDADLVMVRPDNGQNYNSFILDQYFDEKMDGASAADAITQAAINQINALPETVRLEDKAAVQAARQAYELISTSAQRALVTNYYKLTSAEKRIADLEYLQQDTSEPTEPSTEPAGNTFAEPIMIGVVLSVIITSAGIMIAGKRKKQKEAHAQEQSHPETEVSEENE